jgi:hypothetical protein
MRITIRPLRRPMANARQVLLSHVAKVELGRGQVRPSKRWNRVAVNIGVELVDIGWRQSVPSCPAVWVCKVTLSTQLGVKTLRLTMPSI